VKVSVDAGKLLSSPKVQETLRAVARLEASLARCKYCGAQDNGTCAYPSEGKPGCVRDARLSRRNSGD
jgi:hypothetical protein